MIVIVGTLKMFRQYNPMQVPIQAAITFSQPVAKALNAFTHILTSSIFIAFFSIGTITALQVFSTSICVFPISTLFVQILTTKRSATLLAQSINITNIATVTPRRAGAFTPV
jgi:hypothetical protein